MEMENNPQVAAEAVAETEAPVGEKKEEKKKTVMQEILSWIVTIGAAVLKNADTVVGDDGTISFIPNANIFLAALIALLTLAMVLPPLFRLLKTRRTHK